jgi:hypothetical protein
MWTKETKEIIIKGNERWGSDVRVKAPYEPITYNGYEHEPLPRVWSEREDNRDEWIIEKEYNIVDKVWKEIIFYGASLEYSYTDLYAHKDVLQRGFNEREMNFLNSYRNRFLLLTNNKQDYIFDNNTLKTYIERVKININP